MGPRSHIFLEFLGISLADWIYGRWQGFDLRRQRNNWSGGTPVSGLIDGILGVSPALAYTLVALLVFAEDALFIGFVIPGETAAVLGGVVASRGQVQLGLMMGLVVLAAVVGDTVGYEVGKHAGPRLLESRVLNRHREKLDKAQDFLRRRGGSAGSSAVSSPFSGGDAGVGRHFPHAISSLSCI
jgi:hypothetical protein